MECIQAPYRLIFYNFPVSSNRLFIQTHMQHNYLRMNESVFIRMCAWDQFSCVDFVAWCVHIVRLINSKKEIFTPVPFRQHRNPRYWNPKKIPKKWTIKMSLLCVQCTGWLNFHIKNSILWWFGGGNDDTTTTRHWCHYMIWSYRISVTRVPSHPII